MHPCSSPRTGAENIHDQGDGFMKFWTKVAVSLAAAAAMCVASVAPAAAASLILNGGFESGFGSWTRIDQLGSGGQFFLQSGTSSPIAGDIVPAPSGGLTAAMTDADSPGSHVLYQDFVVPGVGSAVLTFDLFIGNRAPTAFPPVWASPATLAFDTPVLNQQARVDLLVGGSNPFSLAGSDIVQNVYQTKVGDPLIAGYFTVSLDLTSVLASRVGQTIRLRFAEVDNLAPFQFGVDRVGLETTPVPEPTSLVLLGAGLAALVVRRRRR
jgi:hypothetical protein